MSLSSVFEYSLVEIHPRLHSAWYKIAHDWMMARPWAFPRSGGYLRFSTYLQKAAHPAQTDVAVFVGPVMISLLTTERSANNEYCAHVTSPKRSDSALIIAAAREVLNQHFTHYKASAIYSHCPTIDGHLHRGSQALCEGVGLIRRGVPEVEYIRGHRYEWRPYDLTREEWLHYGRQNQDHAEQSAAESAIDPTATGAAAI